MGYCTTYNMTVQHIKDGEQYEALCDALKDKGVIGYAIDYDMFYGNTAEFCSNYDVKWYDHEENMKEISKLFPDMVFQLRGQGEDPEDMWEKYFQNGYCEECRAEITIPRPIGIRWE